MTTLTYEHGKAYELGDGPSFNAYAFVSGALFAVLGAVVANRETIRVYLTQEPQHLSFADPVDALNPSNWTVALISGGSGGDPIPDAVGTARAVDQMEFDVSAWPNAWSVDVHVDRRLDSGALYEIVGAAAIADAAGTDDLSSAAALGQDRAQVTGVWAAPTPLITSWCTVGLNWLLAQFRNKPKIAAVLCVLLDQVQALEAFLTEANELRALGTAEGAQLDDVGVELGFQRDYGVIDSDYRTTLQAVAIARASDGYADEMISILSMLLAGASPFTLTEYFPASYRLEITDQVVSYEGGHRMARVLHEAKPIGVGGALIYAPLGLPIISFDDDTVHPAVPFAEEGVGGSGGVLMEEEG